MVRVALSSFLAQYTGGETELEVEAGNIRQLFRSLGERYPALKPHIDAELAVAIDGEIYQDALLQPIPADSEVVVLPRIAGG